MIEIVHAPAKKKIRIPKENNFSSPMPPSLVASLDTIQSNLDTNQISHENIETPPQ